MQLVLAALEIDAVDEPLHEVERLGCGLLWRGFAGRHRLKRAYSGDPSFVTLKRA
jgi:hypothetical protein